MLNAEDSQLLIVDMQTGLAAAIPDADTCLRQTILLLCAARELGVPVIVSEHYPKGLGHTHPDLLPLLDRALVLPKIAFSCHREEAVAAAIEASRRRQVVLAGMETHVCVQQTGLDLQRAGFAVHLAADAAGSRRREDRERAIERMRGHGIEIITAEMAVFEWLRRGEGTAFKALIPLVKAGVPERRSRHVAAVSVLVPDYDEAIDHYTRVLGFDLVEDTPLGGGKRWVLVAPPGGGGTRLLLARAANAEQAARIGDQAGGRVFLFLDTDDFARDYERLHARGVAFEEAPREESYGRVAVFRDRYGNRWDLVERWPVGSG